MKDNRENKITMRPSKLLILFVIFYGTVFYHTPVLAKDYAYQGKVKGMVCAFCAYNVSKKIAQLSGVNVASVNVDLKPAKVDFFAASPIEQEQVKAVFSDSGFTLVDFKVVVQFALSDASSPREPLVTLNFDGTAIEQVETILNTIGSLAVSQPAFLSVKAPQSAEIAILKPILAGRQTVIKVNFLPVTTNTVELTLYSIIKAAE